MKIQRGNKNHKKFIIFFVMSIGACKNYITFYHSNEAVPNFRKILQHLMCRKTLWNF